MVTLAARASTGHKLAMTGEFDLAIVDVMLPDGSGFDLCRAIREQAVLTPILFLSARGEVSDRIEGLDAGADDYLRKPFALAELHARVRALGRRHGLAAQPRLEQAGTTIDFAGRRLSREGREVPLTAREWAVLEVLAARAGRVVSRDEVIESAWPDPGPGASESLDVIVSRLRRKLGESAWIRTVRGHGLVFELPS